MSAPQVETGWSLHGMQALVLRNEHLTVVILPALGGRVWEVHDRLSGRQLLWHHPRLTPRPVPFGAAYDDSFFGGWDELFPNDIPEQLVGEPFPDHGELWCSPWTWEVVDGPPGAGSIAQAAVVRLRLSTPISAITIEKVVTLRPDSRSLEVDEVITSSSPEPLPFLWKQHVAVALHGGGRIDVPAGRMELANFGRPRAGASGVTYAWPTLTDVMGTHDMATVLPHESRVAEFQFGTELADGWCALTHPDGSGIGLRFDNGLFESCWLFASYGGWRGLDVVVLEPCTGTPLSVAEGAAAGTHRTLHPGERIETSMRLVAYDGLARVTGIDGDGHVSGVRV